MFKKYNSIENTYREEFLERIKSHGFWNEEFIVQEKAHGANLSFWTINGEDFFASKRTQDIAEGEKFYNYEFILEEIKPKLQNIWKDLKKEHSNLQQLTVFGEVIGGDYPHPETEPNKKALQVQKGIYYSPLNHFFAFDILLNSEEYLDVKSANHFFENQNLLHAKTIFKGTIEECLKHPNDFNSTIPTEFGLPELTPNIIEGVIIRPCENKFFNNGVRVILKNKNEKWAENKKFHKTIKPKEEVSEKIIKLQEAILTYVTENRLHNVLSKIGEVSPKDFGRILGMFQKDVVEDFMKDYSKIMEELDKKEVKLITKSISKNINKLVKNVAFKK